MVEHIVLIKFSQETTEAQMDELIRRTRNFFYLKEIGLVDIIVVDFEME